MFPTAFDPALAPLLVAAVSLGLIHTVLGPDHYLPFILLSKSRGWSLGRTLRLTAACGVGHVAASVLLGLVGVAAGLAIGSLETLEALRGNFAAWLLFGFGLAYAAWGVRQAVRNRPHSHWHSHSDGLVHRHDHVHHGKHAHPHFSQEGARRPTRRWAAWSLFAIFVVGPCEPLIPLLMVPSAQTAWLQAGLVAGAFAVTTIATMTLLVAAGRLGLTRLPLTALERYGHVVAGLVLAACGAAMWAGL